ncbi:MAG: hypothetical protein D6719_11475 [Candidatus Dadabacteria bacterium]|nr:MAG: hypothetical protein D6719_11475 [Candidatus Dadabacteria bacterium]
MRPVAYIFCAVFLCVSSVQALPTLSGKITVNSISRLVVQNQKRNSSANIKKSRFKARARDRGNRAALISSNGKAAGAIVFGIKSGGKVYTFKKAQEQNICSASSARAVMAVKRKLKSRRRRTRQIRLRGLTYDSENSIAYPTSINGGKPDTAARNLALVDSNCVPVGSHLGYNTNKLQSSVSLSGFEAFASNDTDGDGIEDSKDLDDDGDGMPDAFDIDDDGDGILDNDDSDSDSKDSSTLPVHKRQFFIFSNFHLDMEESLNANVMTVTKSMIDSALVDNAGLAIQVIGDGTLEVELDCGSLSYCSTGGTGRTLEPYPDGLKFPEDLDSDGNGYGKIEPGSTGDFQLKTGATSDEIKAGDVLIQRVKTKKGKTVQVPGMLNFIFHTVPAATKVVTGVKTYNITYPVSAGDPGTATNCFKVPASGTVSVTVTAQRPQRAGITEAGEATLMDMGNLKLITNIPNAPCTTDANGQCTTDPGSGPGLCSGSVYSTSDPNLTVVSDGLQDSLGDQAADPSHTFTYTIDLTACLSAKSISWNSGETLKVPLQMMNVYGDNAAQDLCFTRQ